LERLDHAGDVVGRGEDVAVADHEDRGVSFVGEVLEDFDLGVEAGDFADVEFDVAAGEVSLEAAHEAGGGVIGMGDAEEEGVAGVGLAAETGEAFVASGFNAAEGLEDGDGGPAAACAAGAPPEVPDGQACGA
jgi:hypothetical protein